MPTRCNRGFYCRSYCLLQSHPTNGIPDTQTKLYTTKNLPRTSTHGPHDIRHT